MRTQRSRGFTLIELMVIVLVVAILLAILVPFVESRRMDSRRTQCANNMRTIGLALVDFTTSKNCFPNAGTFYDDPAIHQGDPFRSNIYRAIMDPGGRPGAANPLLRSWVVEILPYLDEQGMYNAWNFQKSYLSTVRSVPSLPSNAQLASTVIGVLICPDDFTASPGQGNLSYVVNGGFARWHAVPVGWSGSPVDGKSIDGDILEWAPPMGTWVDNQAAGKRLGVMFLGTHTGDQPWDIATRPADVYDGMSTTLLIAENILAGASKGTRYSGGLKTNWACPLPNFAMFLGSDDICRTAHSTTNCLGGQLKPGPEAADGKGWARANQVGTFENINFGQSLTVEGSFPFANSAHRGGGNMTFCDGAVRFIADTIDGTVYAKILTSAGSRLPGNCRQLPVNTDCTCQ